MLAYDGPRLGNTDLSISKRLRVMVSFSQTIDSEEDVDKKCKNYPFSGHKNYRECDETLVYNEFKSKFSYMLPGLAKDLDEVSSVIRKEQIKT